MRSALVSSQAMCPIVEDRFSRTRLGSSDPNGPNFKEVSGLAFSPSQTYNGNPVFFAVSDGGGDARIGIFDSESGKRLRTLRVDRNFFRNADWESMTMGSCGRSGSGDNCLYIMDAGDNQARMNNGNKGRDDYAILKIREPRWTDYSDNDEIPTSRMAKMRFDYRHSSSPTNYADCESMFIDHTGWGDGEEKGGACPKILLNIRLSDILNPHIFVHLIFHRHLLGYQVGQIQRKIQEPTLSVASQCLAKWLQRCRGLLLFESRRKL